MFLRLCRVVLVSLKDSVIAIVNDLVLGGAVAVAAVVAVVVDVIVGVPVMFYCCV